MPGIMDSLNPIGAAMGGVGQLLGSVLGFFNQRAILNQQKEQASRILEGSNFERDLLQNVYDPLRQNLLGQMDMSNLLAFGSADNPGLLLQLGDRLGMQPQQIASLFSQIGVTPEQSQWLDQLGGWAGGDRSVGEMLSGRGGNAAAGNDQLTSFFSNLLNGGMSQSALQAGEQLLQNGGATGGTNYLADRLQEIIGNGGKNADLTSLMQVLNGGVATGGMTNGLQSGIDRALSLLNNQNPNQQKAINAAQQLIDSGGYTADSRAAIDEGLKRISQNPLLSTNDAVGYLTSTLGSQAAKMGAEGERQAALRGGGQAAIVNSGSMDQSRKAASGAALETIGNAITDTLRKQQDLGLQNNQIGANLLNQGSGVALNRMGQGASLLDSMLGRGLQQDQTGFSGLNQSQGTADQRLATFLQSALTGTGQAGNNLSNALSQFGGNNQQTTANLLAGGQLSDSFYRNLFGAASGMNSAIGNDANLAGLGLNFNNAAYGALNQGLNGTLAGMNYNRQTVNDFLNQNNTNLTNSMNLGQLFMTLGQNANQGLGNLVNGTQQNYGTLLSSLGRIFGH